MQNKLIYLSLAVLTCFGIYFFGFQRKKRNWERIPVLFLALSLFLVLILRCIAAFRRGSWEWLFTGIKTVFDVLEGNSGEFRTALAAIPAIPELLSCAVPALAVFTAARLLWHYLPHHVPLFKKEWLLFSELDANSVRMAKNLARKDRLCIFLRTPRSKAAPELLSDLGDIHFFLYPGDEARFLLWPWRRGHILRFFFLSENTDRNFQRMQDFLLTVQEKSLFAHCSISLPEGQFQQELYLLSETESAPMLIDHLRGLLKDTKIFQNTDLRLLDRYRAISYDLLRSKPLHRHIRDGRLNILVLGFGKIGREFFRTTCSLGTLHDCRTEFTLCDQQIGTRLGSFLSQCPELRKSVTILPRKLNVETDALERLIKASEYHYILVALGDDERNIRVASRLKRFYRRHHWEYQAEKCTEDIQPQICVNIEDQIKHDYTLSLWTDASQQKNAKSWDKALHIFGGLDQVFTPEVLMPRVLWNAARFIHREMVSMEPRQRRSSIDCAVRAEYLCDTVCDGKKRTEYERCLRAADRSKYADTEHLCWMAYVRSEGLCHADTDLVDAYFDPDHGKHVDILGKLTPCLTEDQKMLDAVWAHLSQGIHAADYKDKHPFRWKDEHLVDLAGKIARMSDPGK